MTAKTELMKAHEAMAAVLDAKFSGSPEWTAFRAIDRALLALETESAERKAPTVELLPAPRFRAPPRTPSNGHGVEPLSYTALTDVALRERGRPIPTPQLMEYIGSKRRLADDAERAKVTVTSTLSKSQHFRSVPWEGGRAWWFADRPVPKTESAG